MNTLNENIDNFLNLDVTYKPLSFSNSQITYRTFRTDWKSHYKTLSQSIRDTRSSFKNEQRNSGGFPTRETSVQLEMNKAQARDMLITLHVTKAENKARRMHGGL